MNILDGINKIRSSSDSLDIINTLSVGGKGCVYLARNSLNESFALKVYYHREYEKDTLSKLLLKDNKDLVKKNSYEFVLPIEIFKIKVSEKPHTCFITRYVEEGKNVDGFIKTFRMDRDFNYEEYLKKALKVMYNISLAFSHLHQRGYCYTNIDQSTIRININNLKVYIIKTDDITERENPVTDKMGSTRYLAPERIEKKLPPSCRTDRFSLSVLFFELITLGLHPYIGSRTYNDYVESSINYGSHFSTIREYNTLSNYILNYKDKAPYIFDKNIIIEKYNQNILKYYQMIPEEIRDLFTQEFAYNVRNPENRIHITKWKEVLEKYINE